jgi:hypothetical protein
MLLHALQVPSHSPFVIAAWHSVLVCTIQSRGQPGGNQALLLCHVFVAQHSKGVAAGQAGRLGWGRGGIASSKPAGQAAGGRPHGEVEQ